MRTGTSIRTELIVRTDESVHARLAGDELEADILAFRNSLATDRTQTLADFEVKEVVAFAALAIGDLLQFCVVVPIDFLLSRLIAFRKRQVLWKNENLTSPTVIKSLHQSC